MAIGDRLLAEFDLELATTNRLLDRADTLPCAWRPHPRSRSMGELLAHLADVPAWGLRILDHLTVDLAQLPAPTKAADAATLRTHFRDGCRVVRGRLLRTDAELMAVWRLTRGDDDVYTMPRSTAFRRLVLNHLVHHRGQLSVYVRMCGLADAPHDETEVDPGDYAPST